MKILHLHFKTRDLDQSVAFYSALFGAEPTQREDDYAKWLLDDPRAHISVSTHGGEPGFDHAGISVDTKESLDALGEAATKANAPAFIEDETTCCYARSNKVWTRSPEGTSWELFQTFGASQTYGAEPDRELLSAEPGKIDQPLA